jgi:hypothetical protein
MATTKVTSHKVVLALLGAVALAGLSSSAYALDAPGVPGGPPGTYKSSCQNILTSRNFHLQAVCKTESGGNVQTILDLRACAAGSDIGNNHGQLQCAPLENNVPNGSYRQSCVQISIDSLASPTLAAACENSAGKLQSTSLKLGTCVSGSDIGNNNGRLQCNTGKG